MKQLDDSIAPDTALPDELSVAEAGLQRIATLIQTSAEKSEQDNLFYALSTFGRLLEKEKYTPTETNAERLRELVQGLYADYVHATATPLEDNLVEVEFYHTIRRKLAGRFVFEKRFGSYYIKFVELLPLKPLQTSHEEGLSPNHLPET